MLHATLGLYGAVIGSGVSAASFLTNPSVVMDGKWHHVLMFYDDGGTRKIYLAIDGKWATSYSVQDALTGSIVDDSGSNLIVGARYDGASPISGSLGWTRISNNARYTVGTDFIPSRTPPAPDANTLAQWNMTEGTGTTVDNVEGTAARDGTISNGTWLTTWQDEGSPVVNNTSLQFNGSTTLVNCGSDAGLDNLQDNALTLEVWFRQTVGADFFLEKGNYNDLGWGITKTGAKVHCATTDATASYTIPSDGRWHHLAMTWDDAGDRKIRLWADGVLVATSSAGVGAVLDESAYPFLINARNPAIAQAFNGAIDWVRISNVVRYTTNFTPPARFAPPAVDGNTVAQWNFEEGAGTTVDNAEGTAGRDGTITAGTWLNTRDLSVDSPGSQMFAGGHIFYADAADEGIKQTFSGLTAGADYVIRALAFAPSYPLTGRPRLAIYDETNGALIKTMDGWSQYELVANGTFDTDTLWTKGTGWTIDAGDSNKAHCDGSQTANSQLYQPVANALNGGLVIGKLYKVVFTISGYSAGVIYPYMGGTSGTQRAADGTYTDYLRCGTANAIFSMMADADFIGDIDNVSVTSIPEYNHPDVLLCSFELPTVARHGVAADCTSISVKLLSSTVGVVGYHQVELLPNLLDNPSFDFGAAADPWIPAGWINYGLDAGDSEEEATIISSSGKSLQLNSTASTEGLYESITTTSGRFHSVGCGYYGSGNLNLPYVSNGFLHKSATLDYCSFVAYPYWKRTFTIFRNTSTSRRNYFYQTTGTLTYLDDVYDILLDDVTLTATPASLANSLESGGIRVDGYDALIHPVTKLSATKGRIQFRWIPRHSSDAMMKFGYTAETFIFHMTNAGDYLRIFYNGANSLRVAFWTNGVLVYGDWNSTGAIISGTSYLMDLKYTASGFILKVDGIERLNISGAIKFSSFPANMNFGQDSSGAKVIDSVFLAP